MAEIRVTSAGAYAEISPGGQISVTSAGAYVEVDRPFSTQIYYVRKTGNDENVGTSAVTAFSTIIKAVSVAEPGDTVYIGAGTYYGVLPLRNSGTPGKPISYVGDVDGRYTGDPGIILVTNNGPDPLSNVAVGTEILLDLGDKTFLTFENINFEGNTGTANSLTVASSAGRAGQDLSLEGIRFINCNIKNCKNSSVELDFNYGISPATSGIYFEGCNIASCYFYGMNNATAHKNMKVVFNRCIFGGFKNEYSFGAYITGGTGTYKPCGYTLNNCTFMEGNYSPYVYTCSSTTYPTVFNNCIFSGKGDVYMYTASTGEITTYGCIRAKSSTVTITGGITAAETPRRLVTYLSGRDDTPLRQNMFGYSINAPYLAPITIDGRTNYFGGGYPITISGDIYNYPTTSRKGTLYSYLDGSSVAPSDPNSSWANESQLIVYNNSSYATANSLGSLNSNYLLVGGIAIPSGAYSVSNVSSDIVGYASSSAVMTVAYFTKNLEEYLGSISISGAVTNHSGFRYLAIPSGGWTVDKAKNIEVKLYISSGSGVFYIYTPTFRVEVSPGTTVGAVEPNYPLTITQSGTTLLYGGQAYSAIEPIGTAPITISVLAKRSPSYSGAMPRLEVKTIPYVSDQIVTMSGSADQWETLSTTFTPTVSGICRIAFRSFCTNDIGQVEFSVAVSG